MRHLQIKTLTDQEQLVLLRETARSPDDLRDHLLFSLALGCGLRVGELTSLNIGDVKGPRGVRGIIALRPETTKNGRGGDVVVPERLRRKLSKFISWKKDRGQSVTMSAPLLCSRGGGRGRNKAGGILSVRGAQQTFKAWQERVGFDWSLGFHQLRHSFCSNLLRQTGNLRLVQLAARHSDPKTTAIYSWPTSQDLVVAVQALPC